MVPTGNRGNLPLYQEQYLQQPLITQGTLNCRFEGVKLQFLSAVGQQQLAPGRRVGEMEVASLPDVAAAKLKVIGDRGELRDYYDLMCIEEKGTDIEDVLDWYCLRYGVERTDQSVYHIVRALGSFHDVADDPWLAGNVGRRTLIR